MKNLTALLLLLSFTTFSWAEETPPPKFASDRLTVEVIGAGPEVLLLPGFGCSVEVWRPLAKHLAATRRVHLVQPAGFAGSPWTHDGDEFLQPFVKELDRYLKETHLAAPAIIGHSMGGLVALMLAQQSPDAVGRIMTVDSLPFFGALFGAQMTPEMAKGQAQMIAAMILMADDAAFRAQQVGNGPRMTRDEAMRKVIAEWAVKSDRKALAAAMLGILSTDARPGLAAMKLPVWALYATDAKGGAKDSESTPLWTQQYAALPKVKLVRVDESRHFIMVDQPEKFTALVDEFLR